MLLMILRLNVNVIDELFDELTIALVAAESGSLGHTGLNDGHLSLGVTVGLGAVRVGPSLGHQVVHVSVDFIPFLQLEIYVVASDGVTAGPHHLQQMARGGGPFSKSV